MKYGMNNLIKTESDNSYIHGVDYESSVREFARMSAEQDIYIENCADFLTTANQLMDIEADARVKLESDNLDYDMEAVKLERDINSSLALIGGSFMSGKYGRSALSPKIENDILNSKGKKHYQMKMEGIGDVLKTIWEKIKAFFKRIWEFLFGKEKKREETIREVERKIEVILKEDDFKKTLEKAIEDGIKEGEKTFNEFMKQAEERAKKENERIAKLGVGLMLRLNIEKVKSIFETSITFAEAVEKHYDLESTSSEFMDKVWDEITRSKYVDGDELVSGSKGKGPDPIIAINSTKYWSLVRYTRQYGSNPDKANDESEIRIIDGDGTPYDGIYNGKGSIAVLGAKAKKNQVYEVVEAIENFVSEFPSIQKDITKALKDIEKKMDSMEKEAKKLTEAKDSSATRQAKGKYATINTCLMSIVRAMQCLDSMLIDFNIVLNIIIDYYKIKPKK